MASSLEADFNYLLRVLSKAQPIDVDWYAVSDITRDQGRGQPAEGEVFPTAA